MNAQDRNYALAQHLSHAADDILVSVPEVAALTGLADRTIQQRRISGFPQPIKQLRHLRWRLGDIRAWIRSSTGEPAACQQWETPDHKYRHTRRTQGLQNTDVCFANDRRTGSSALSKQRLISSLGQLPGDKD